MENSKTFCDLDHLGEILISFSEHELHWSALLIANSLIDTASDLEYHSIIKSFFHLKFFKKIQELINKKPHLLKYKEIRLFYIKSGYDIEENKNSIVHFVSSENKNENDSQRVDHNGKVSNEIGIESSNFYNKIANQRNKPNGKVSNRIEVDSFNIYNKIANQRNNLNSEVYSSNIYATDSCKTRINSHSINSTSLELFFQAMSKQESIRKKLLLDSFYSDTSNIEALIFLFKESLCNTEELKGLIDKIQIESLKQIMTNLIYHREVDECMTIPLFLFSTSSNLFFPSNHPNNNFVVITSNSTTNTNTNLTSNLIFRSATKNLELFLESELIYHSLGIYYLIKNRNREALKCFYKAIELNKFFGQGYLLAGIAHSRMRETETAVNIFNSANYIIVSSFVPSYCLACEYQTMNNIPVAKYHYKNAIRHFENENLINHSNGKNFNNSHSSMNIIKKRKANIHTASFYKEKVLNSYIYCLIYNEEYDEALNILNEYSINNVLRVFCYLFIGKLKEAKESLELCVYDGRYYACKGFIMHIVEDFECAVKSYERSLNIKRNKVVEKLMLMAQENFVNLKENKSYDYTNCLFESLGYNDPIF